MYCRKDVLYCIIERMYCIYCIVKRCIVLCSIVLYCRKDVLYCNHSLQDESGKPYGTSVPASITLDDQRHVLIAYVCCIVLYCIFEEIECIVLWKR